MLCKNPVNLILMEPQNKTCTAISRGSSKYPKKLSENLKQHFFKDQRSKFKKAPLKQLHQMKSYNISYYSPFLML